MSTEKDKLKKVEDVKENSPLKPDPETLHTTDPQEEMKGPISSLVQGVKEKMEEPQKPEEDNDQDKK